MICQGIYLLDGLLHMELEADAFQKGIQLGAGDGRMIVFQQFHQPTSCRTQGVALPDGGPELFFGDLHTEGVLQIVDEPLEFADPHVPGIGHIPALGQVENVCRLALPQQLVHFLFAVAGGLSHDQIGKIGVGALVGEIEAVAGLDQRAQVAGQLGLGGRDGLGAHAAQADGQQSGSIQDLQRGKGAKASGHLLALFFGGFYGQESGFAGIGKFLEGCGQRDFVHVHSSIF